MPLGQRVEGREFVPDAAEQAAIERIRALHAQGRSLCEIIAVLDVEGHRTKQPWGSRASRGPAHELARCLWSCAGSPPPRVVSLANPLAGPPTGAERFTCLRRVARAVRRGCRSRGVAAPVRLRWATAAACLPSALRVFLGMCAIVCLRAAACCVLPAFCLAAWVCFVVATRAHYPAAAPVNGRRAGSARAGPVTPRQPLRIIFMPNARAGLCPGGVLLARPHMARHRPRAMTWCRPVRRRTAASPPISRQNEPGPRHWMSPAVSGSSGPRGPGPGCRTRPRFTGSYCEIQVARRAGRITP